MKDDADDRVAQFLAETGRACPFKRGDILATAVGFVEEGVLAVVETLADGRRILVELFHDGDFIDLRQDAPDWPPLGRRDVADAGGELLALVPGEMVLIDAALAEEGLTRDPVLARAVARQQRSHLNALRRHVVDLAGKTPIERLASLILELKSWSTHGDRPRLALRVPSPPPSETLDIALRRSDLADYIGVTPETLSRTLKQLRDEDVIALEGTTVIRIVSPRALEDIAAGGRPRAHRGRRGDD